VSANPTGCGHYQMTVRRDDGSTYVADVHEDDTSGAFTTADDTLLATLCAKRVRAVSGLTMAQLAGRVLIGSESTNVRVYDFIGPGAAITKTNIGLTYVNVCVGLNGERILVDLTGAIEYRIIVTANLVGTGPFGLRAVRDGDNVVLFENASIALTGERELDTDWQTIPGGFNALTLLRFQAKSNVAADDPVFRRACVLIR